MNLMTKTFSFASGSGSGLLQKLQLWIGSGATFHPRKRRVAPQSQSLRLNE